ncbi:hypothetical protein PilKf_01819 [Pillotina sp. SPG140]|jgi:radical SAM superfamily enzyme YgiQ (UPF0313 family)
MRGMNLIIPPICDLTVPLLGAYQLAGYAEIHGYPLLVHDFNIKFCEAIVDYSTELAKKADYAKEKCIETKSIIKFLSTFADIKNYNSLLNAMQTCREATRYWDLMDYLRASYDLFSFQFSGLRFRIDGLDCKYKWNIWSDIEAFVSEYSVGTLMNYMRSMIKNINLVELDTVGISVTFESQLFISLLICIAIREYYSNLQIVIGGGFVNSFINSADSMGPIAKYCNCVFSGEGEALLQFLINNESSALIDLENRMQPLRACYANPEAVCNDILQVSPPRFTPEQLNMYLSPKKIIPLRFSYDCYWRKCRFCADKEQHGCLEKKYNLELMIDYCISEYEKNHIDGIYFLDSAINPNTLRKFAVALTDRYISFPWGTNLRFESAFNDDDLIRLLVKSGFVFAKFGLESGSQDILDLMDKGTHISIAASIINKFRRYGILVHTYVMVAYPGEKPNDRALTEQFLLSDDSHPDNYNCSEFILYGTAKLAAEYKEYLISDNNIDGWYSASYSFTNDSIKSFISNMRKQFDAKFSPQSVLLSTGHTIAYSGLLSNVHTDSSSKPYVKLSERVLFSEIDNIPYLIWWRRNRGCSYICGDGASFLNVVLNLGVLSSELKNCGLSDAIIDQLWDECCIVASDTGFSYNCVAVNNVGELKITQYSKFDDLKWYGYYDAE